MATEVMTRDGKMLPPTKTIISSISLPENEDTQSLDLISKLPDDILCFILSRLSSMRDAVKTSILSRRWRYLWRTSLENLSFDEGNGELDWIYGEIAFVKHINKILEQLDCCGTAIQSFQVRSDLELPKYKDEIDNWLQFAAYKKVQKLDVDLDCFSPEEFRNLDPELYLFPYWLFTNDQYKGSTLTHLTLSQYSFNLPAPKFRHFRSLISLTLNCLPMTQEILVNILSNCLSLLSLSLIHCYCSGSLKFSSRSSSSSRPSPKLKLLNIKKCDELKMVDICDLENLTSFGIFGNRLTELLCNQRAPVTRVYYEQYHFSSIEEYDIFPPDIQLPKNFPLQKTLLYVSTRMRANRMPTNLPTFAHLNHLVLVLHGFYLVETYSLLEPTVTFLKASPLLQNLSCVYGKSSMNSIRLWMEKKQREISSESWQHCNLREVEIFNFHGNRREVELVWYLGIHTVALGKIRVHRKDRTYEGDGSWSDRNPEVDIRRGRIFNMLHQRIPAATKLILL